MSIFTAHRILIALAVVCFAVFAVVEWRVFASSGRLSTGITALLSVIVAIGFAVYWRTIPRR
jgi:hypothetical protein